MLYPDRYADFHLHAYAPFGKGFEACDTLASLGVTDANLLAYTYIETGIDNNLVCLYYKDKAKRVRLRTFGGLYYDKDLSNKTMPYREQAELLLAMGCDGIKFLDMKPNYNLYCGCNMDDDVYDDMYNMLEERGVPLDIHIADPASFWDPALVSEYARKVGWFYADPKFLTQQQIFDSAVHRLEKNPNLRITFAHFGFMSTRLALCRSIFERFPNVCFDLAPAAEIFVDFAKDIEPWREFFMQYSERILYGTDTALGLGGSEYITSLNATMKEFASHDTTECPIPCRPLQTMRGFDLPEKAQRDILHDNFFRVLGSSPKPVDRALFKEHSRLIRSIAEKQGLADILASLDVMDAGM